MSLFSKPKPRSARPIDDDDDAPVVTSKKKAEASDDDFSDFVVETSVSGIKEDMDKLNNSEMKKYEQFLPQLGDNVLYVLPGRSSSGGKPLMARITHGMHGACTRSSRQDRFETCALCGYWWDNHTTKEQRDTGTKKVPGDDLRPKEEGTMQIIDVTWACYHKQVRNDKGELIEKLDSAEIDERRIRGRECFLNESKFDIESDKCKSCPAFRSCYQGPQFLKVSKPRVEEMLVEQERIGKNKTGKLNGKTVDLTGNITLAWSVVHGDESIAEKVSYPLIYTKSLDSAKGKEYGTSYKFTFGREAFVLPIEWQKRALRRSRDLNKYMAPITMDESQKVLAAFVKALRDNDKPSCYNNADKKDSDECSGDACSHYDSCCKKSSAKGAPKGSKQGAAIRNMSVDDDDDDGEKSIDIKAFVSRMQSDEDD